MGRAIVIGKWSELILTWVDQVEAKARCAKAKVRSGEDGFPLVGRRVGVSSFRMINGLLSMTSANESPQASDKVESQPP